MLLRWPPFSEVKVRKNDLLTNDYFSALYFSPSNLLRFYSADGCDRCILAEEDWRMIVGADKESPSWLQVNFSIS